MKKQILKTLAMSLIATLALSGCSVHTREYNRKPPRRDRHHDDRRDRDHDRNNNYNRY